MSSLNFTGSQGEEVSFGDNYTFTYRKKKDTYYEKFYKLHNTKKLNCNRVLIKEYGNIMNGYCSNKKINKSGKGLVLEYKRETLQTNEPLY